MSKTQSKTPPTKPARADERSADTEDDGLNLGEAPTFAGWPQLYAKNLDEVRRWYRNASNAGREMKHIVLCEMIFSHTCAALALALQGKQWAPPAHLP